MKFDYSTESASVKALDYDSTYAFVHRIADELGLSDTHDIDAFVLQTANDIGLPDADEACDIDAIVRQTENEMGLDDAVPSHPTTSGITATLLRAIQALGPEGIKDAGGRLGLARQHGVSCGLLCNYIYEDGSLTPLGKAKIQENMRPPTGQVTATLLGKIQALGPEGFKGAGGRLGLARQYGVRYGSLCNYIHEDGSLTPLGKAKIQENMRPPTEQVTATLLGKIQALGPEGITGAGGRLGLARQYGVRYGSLCNYIHEDGSLTPLGKAKIQENMRPPTEKVTATLLGKIQALGPEGFKDAGGRLGLARRYSVRCRSLCNYIYGDGSLTPRGEVKIQENMRPPTEKVTATLLGKILALGPEGIKDAGGLPALARHYGVSCNTLFKEIRTDGSLTPFGEAKIRKQSQ
ncbi:hypothetical protein LGM46_20745 [Burkholderia arboris]|uniref:HTH psq-type domain-containing protein n=1 Tax=Burkholderia metallica TaxID=488729 RepID=A0ABT8P8N1_9BURK|nr:MULTISPECIES: hypothetical protein [Burkholderia cepacia complex]MCA8035397.1 hypothetical protein [Burkholderia arboris]MDN7931456.1 hypothetical protein [Burkholderia metallica]